MCKVYLPSVFECFIQVAAVDGSVLLRFEVDDLKEAQCLETSFEFAPSSDRTGICFRQSKRRRNCPLQSPRLTSIASRRISVHFLSQHLTQPLSHQRLKLPLQHCGLPVCSRQDGNWTLEDEEAPVNRGTSKPGTWCFVLSSFCNASVQIDVIVYNFLMYFCCRLAFRSDCYGFTIPSA